jgi:hypothetical protein
MYKSKINNIEDKRLPKIASNSNQNRQELKKGWYKDVKSSLNHSGIRDKVTL